MENVFSLQPDKGNQSLPYDYTNRWQVICISRTTVSSLGFRNKDSVRSGVGQLTTFNQLGFAGIADKPDGWYLPDNHADTAIVLETKASYITLGDKQVDELLKM